MALRHRYVYNGPVLEFDHLLCSKWNGETIANTEAEAKKNLAYNFKKENNRLISARISLPGKIKEMEAVM